LGALGVRMSGSGPTVFGVFETERDCRHAGLQLNRTTGWRIAPAATLTSSPFGE
jgi:4-diphosphocytidyl-2C-methyl-D-erythritol kinase